MKWNVTIDLDLTAEYVIEAPTKDEAEDYSRGILDMDIYMDSTATDRHVGVMAAPEDALVDFEVDA